MGYRLTCSLVKIPFRTAGHECERSFFIFIFFVLFIMSYTFLLLFIIIIKGTWEAQQDCKVCFMPNLKRIKSCNIRN